jgi:signal transduction histidine kinase
VPATLLLVGVCATATALVGGTAATLGRRGALPAVLGPVAATLVLGAKQVLQASYVGANGLPDSTYLNPVHHLTTSSLVLLAAAAGLVGLRGAEALAARRAERRAAAEIRRQAAAAERQRLARPIHDGVLQVLALMQRHGPELGEQGAQLAELARAHGTALRGLIAADATAPAERGHLDLGALLRPFESPSIQLALPAAPVALPAHQARELAAAVADALDNVRRHAGPHSRAWILVEDAPHQVRVEIRDDGPGFPPSRLAETAAAGRLGVAQSIIGRLADLGGHADITSHPGGGTELDLRLPRARTS